MLPLLLAAGVRGALGAVARVAVRGLVAGGRGLIAGTTLAARTITSAAGGAGRMVAGAAARAVAGSVIKNIVKDKSESIKDKISGEATEDKSDAVRQTADQSQQAPADATRVKDDGSVQQKPDSNLESSASKIQILNSIANQVKILRDNVKSYETFLYQKEQSTEAAQAEKVIEEGDKGFKTKQKVSKVPKGKKEGGGILGAIIAAIAVGIFAFLPLIIKKAKEGMKFLSNFYNNSKEKFTEIINGIKQTVKEYVIDPIRKFFTETIPDAWEDIKFAIQDAIEDLIDAPKNAIDALLQVGNEIVANAVDSIVNFIKENTLLKKLVGKKGISSLEDFSKKRREGAKDIERDREKKAEDKKLAREKRDKDKIEARQARAAAQEQPAAATKVEPGKEEAKPAATKVEPPKEGEVKPSSNGKFSDPDAFAKALFPYAKYVSESLGGKVPPIAFLGQWAGESGSGKSLPADFNYAGIKAFGGFKKGDFVLTEERYTDAQLKRAQQSGESLHRVLDRDTKMDKGKRKVTVDEWYGKGSFDAAEKAGQHWVQVKSYFAKFDSLQDFADGYIKVLKNPRYKKALESGSAAEFGLQVAKAGYATAGAEKYSQHIASYEKEYGSKIGEMSTGTMVASADTGQQLGNASMAAKIEEPAPKPVVVVQGSQPAPQVASAGSAQGSSSTSNSKAAQDLYHMQLAPARA